MLFNNAQSQNVYQIYLSSKFYLDAKVFKILSVKRMKNKIQQTHDIVLLIRGSESDSVPN